MNELLRRNPAVLSQLYARLGEQVKSYHRHYHLGDNTSVTAETARELLESMIYTLNQSGTTLEEGQLILQGRLSSAKKLHCLVEATSPDWESQFRWDTVAALGQYLQRYDPIHFAHRIPELLPYPLLAPIPPEALGLDYAMQYLNCMWLENQILAAMGKAARGDWEAMIPDYWGIPLNLCEQPLIQLLGRQILSYSLNSSHISDSDKLQLLHVLRNTPKEMLRGQVALLCQRLDIVDPNAAAYACFVVDSLYPRLQAAMPTDDLSYIFL